MSKELTLEQSLQAYRVQSVPSTLSWKQKYVKETFSSDNILKCTPEERQRFLVRLTESNITIAPNVKSSKGEVKQLKDLVNEIVDRKNSTVQKTSRKVVFSSDNGERPVGDAGYMHWNGFQLIDMDIKDAVMASRLKPLLFERLKKYNWFLGVVTSSSGKGLHVYTKISVSSEDTSVKLRKLMYMANFRHKYSFVYIACLNLLETLGIDQPTLEKWMDMSMCKPQQGGFIPYDPKALISSHFFEDYIYVNFDNIEDIGSPDIDWVSHPDLKEIFARYEWFTPDDPDEYANVDIQVKSTGDPDFDTHRRFHYKHFERWRLANTLVQIYGDRDAVSGKITSVTKAFQYLRRICTLDIKDKELEADCLTAKRYNKPVDPWAVNRLNEQHGFKIKMNIDHSQDNWSLYDSIDQNVYKLDNPCIIHESPNTYDFHLQSNQYLGDIRYKLLETAGMISLIDAGAGTGKTEMVKQLVREGKKILLVMPFTSTIKSKIENEDNWYWSYGNRKPKLDAARGLAVTVDKFSKMNLMEVKDAGFEYVFIDESHLLFQSEYRPVMAKVIEMIRSTEIPIIMMSGTPIGETVFFPDIVHLRVKKDDLRRKEIRVYQAETSFDMLAHMARHMALDITQGKRILFPTNRGTIFKEEVEAAVRYFLENDPDCGVFRDVKFEYYKKSNVGEKFIDDINFSKSIKDIDVLFCSTYLSVGVDILDQYDFSIYIDDIWMPQELEQFANRIRSRDLYVNVFVALYDAQGNRLIDKGVKPLNMQLNEDEVRDVQSILQLCNSMIERNPVEYKYNSLVSNIIRNNKYIEYNAVENRFYLNEIAYRTIFFERKYREYVQQLYVLVKGMECYGYQLCTSLDKNLPVFKLSKEEMSILKTEVSKAHDGRVAKNTKNIEELLSIITTERLVIYKGVINGEYEIRKGTVWSEDIPSKIMTVKNEEVFSKVIPLFMSMEKLFEVDSIKEIFESCRKKKNSSYNFSAIARIKLLTNIVFNARQNRLDLPIKKFMEETYRLAENNPKVHKREVTQFILDFCKKYALEESSEQVKILMSQLTMDRLEKQFTVMLKCLLNVSRPDKKGIVKLSKAELLWDKKEDKIDDPNSCIDGTLLDEFLNMMRPMDDSVTPETLEESDTESQTDQFFGLAGDFDLNELEGNYDNEEEEEETVYAEDDSIDALENPFDFEEHPDVLIDNTIEKPASTRRSLTKDERLEKKRIREIKKKILIEAGLYTGPSKRATTPEELAEKRRLRKLKKEALEKAGFFDYLTD